MMLVSKPKVGACATASGACVNRTYIIIAEKTSTLEGRENKSDKLQNLMTKG